MSEQTAKIVIGLAVIISVSSFFTWAKPATNDGRSSRKLCVVNAAGWLLLLPVLGEKGHPPPFIFWVLLFVPLNFVLLPMTATALWVCRRDGRERKAYLAAAFGYVVANVSVLFVVPLIWLYLH
ncbi:MAG: hypothetical protein LC746_09895 [Acidobacteria bacterium]|nr:hypothetical protein [Acidobacteriota bacterium]